MIFFLDAIGVFSNAAIGFTLDYGFCQASWRCSSLRAHWPLLVTVALCGRAVALRRVTLNKTDACIRSPAKTLLPQLTKQEVSQLPLQPDALPGARDVSSPYGSLRVYEWGSSNGRKVLLVHGITTPCIALGKIFQLMISMVMLTLTGGVAHRLVEHGCRVMLFGKSEPVSVSSRSFSSLLSHSQWLLRS